MDKAGEGWSGEGEHQGESWWGCAGGGSCAKWVAPTLSWFLSFQVNGVEEVLPCTPSVGVQVSSSGFYTVVTTDFGLRVKFDGNHRVEVTLPSTFGQKVCGMCGNYNGMAADDFLNPEGVLEPDSTSLGNSWQVSNDSRYVWPSAGLETCRAKGGGGTRRSPQMTQGPFSLSVHSCSAGPLPTPACNDTDKQVIASSRFCGLLTDTSGLFQMCHAVLNSSSYFDTCFYDLCELGLDSEALCKSLQSYADACQSLGVKIPVWRNATFCRKSTHSTMDCHSRENTE